jgi:hypothetical protein
MGEAKRKARMLVAQAVETMVVDTGGAHACALGRDGAGHAAWAAGVFCRILARQWCVRSVGRGLPAGVPKRQRAGQARRAGHADAVGYTASHLIVANSWSTDWGDKGYCYLPKAYCTNAQLSSDWWVLRRA